MVRSGAIDLVVVDSVAALTPKAELEGDMGDQHMGLQARLMSQALRKLTGVTHRTGTTLIFLNQLRQKIGVTFGSPEVTTGGNALKFYASMRLDVRRIAQVKIGDEPVGALFDLAPDDPHDFDVGASQVVVFATVALEAVARRVERGAVHLDDEARLGPVEVQCPWSEGSVDPGDRKPGVSNQGQHSLLCV